MNPFTAAKTWIDILLNPALNQGMRGFRKGKHSNGSIPSPDARRKRQLTNKRQRQARQAMYKRLRT